MKNLVYLSLAVFFCIPTVLSMILSIVGIGEIFGMGMGIIHMTSDAAKLAVVYYIMGLLSAILNGAVTLFFVDLYDC